MNKLAANFGVALCGLFTSLLAVVLNTKIVQWTDFNLFTFSYFIILPLGAIGVGLVAASGYYFGATMLHRRASVLLLIQMLAIAVVTHFLMYWLLYETMVFDGGRKLSDAVTFRDFLGAYMTAGHFQIGGMKTGEVGAFGYVLAVLEFLGLMVGSVAIYMAIAEKPACAPCNRFLRKLHQTRSKYYYDAEAANEYYVGVLQQPVQSAKFAAMAAGTSGSKGHEGAFAIHTRLMGCPECKTQVLHEHVQCHNGQEWKQVDELKRQIALPADLDIAVFFQR